MTKIKDYFDRYVLFTIFNFFTPETRLHLYLNYLAKVTRRDPNFRVKVSPEFKKAHTQLTIVTADLIKSLDDYLRQIGMSK